VQELTEANEQLQTQARRCFLPVLARRSCLHAWHALAPGCGCARQAAGQKARHRTVAQESKEMRAAVAQLRAEVEQNG
jgi:hypothetical protein